MSDLFSMSASLGKGQIDLVNKRLENMMKRVSDIRPVFMKVEPQYKKDIQKQFQTIRPGLKASTIENRRRKGFAAGPVLVRTGALINSLTKRTSDTISIMTPKMWMYGTRVKYGIFHQLGTRKLPKRAFLIMTAKFRRYIVKTTKKYILQGGSGF